MKHEKERSYNVDEYLEEMYRCEIEKREIGTKDLAKNLNIKMPSVSEMLSKLMKNKMIDYKPRSKIKLTQKGRTLGKRIYERFNKIKAFLKNLGMNEKDSEKEACILEHVVSEKLLKLIEEKMDK